jgi:hypothetical protein
VSCLNGVSHLNKLLFFYGLSSFVSIVCLAMLLVLCNLKRSVSEKLFDALNYVLNYYCFIFSLYYIEQILCYICTQVLFFLVFIQQLTLLVLLFYWNPAKSADFKDYYIDYIYFVCFAICDNLWLVHNLSKPIKKKRKKKIK